jgi:hypothetical protein
MTPSKIVLSTSSRGTIRTYAESFYSQQLKHGSLQTRSLVVANIRSSASF